MGMFDEVTIEDKTILPVAPEIAERLSGFQSKDFACIMAQITITKDGRLKESGGLFNESNEEDDLEFHGWFNFYTSDDDGDDSWYEFDAKFTDGQLVEVTRRESNGIF